MKLVAPELSELDESWSDEPERIADRRPPLPGMPPAPVMQMPLPRASLPTLPAILPEATLTLPAQPVVRKPRDLNDATWIVRSRRDAVAPVRRRPWWIAAIAGALVVIGALVIAWWPAANVAPMPPPTARAPILASPPATPPVKPAQPAIAHPTKRIAPQKPVAKARPPIKPSAKAAAKPAAKTTSKPAAKTPATPAKKPAGKPSGSAAKPSRDAPVRRAPPV